MQAATIIIGYFVLLSTFQRRPRFTPVTKLLLCYSTLALISTAWSEQPFVTFAKALALFAFVFASAVSAERSRTEAVARLVFLNLPLAICAYALVMVAITPSRAFFVDQGGVRRLQVAFADDLSSNTLGLIGVVAFVACAVLLSNHAAKARVPLYAGSAVAVSVILLTRSRSTIVDLFFALLIVAVVRRSAFKWSALAISGAVVAFVLGGAVIGTFIARGQNSAELSSLSGRVSIWKIGYEDWRRHPLLGGGYYVASQRAMSRSTLYLAYNVTTLDNVVLNGLVETGVVGGVLLIGVMISGAGAALGARGKSASPYVQTAAAASIAVTMHSVAAGGLVRFTVQPVFLVVACELLRRVREGTAENREYTEGRATDVHLRNTLAGPVLQHASDV
jgi:O-antigen ligase